MQKVGTCRENVRNQNPPQLSSGKRGRDCFRFLSWWKISFLYFIPFLRSEQMYHRIFFLFFIPSTVSFSYTVFFFPFWSGKIGCFLIFLFDDGRIAGSRGNYWAKNYCWRKHIPLWGISRRIYLDIRLIFDLPNPNKKINVFFCRKS